MEAKIGVCFTCPECTHHTKDGPWVELKVSNDADPQEVLCAVVKALSAIGGCDASLKIERHYSYRKGEVDEV